MDLLMLIVSLLPFTIMILAFIKLNLSLALYIIFVVCVPYLNIPFGGMTLSFNIVNIVLLLAYVFDIIIKKRKISVKEVSPFVFYFFVTFILMFIEDRVPLNEQFNYWRIELLQVLIIPFVIINMAKNNPTTINYLKWGLFFAMLIAGLYAVFLLLIPDGVNPYLMFMADINGMEYLEGYADDEGRVINRIFSTFAHPLSWCLFLTFFLFIFCVFKKDMHPIFFYGIIGLALFDLMFCGVRTGFAVLVLVSFYILIRLKRIKYFVYATIIGSVFLCIISSNDELFDYFYSIVDNSETTNKGSDLEMRISQWEACVKECDGRELQGNGYRFSSWYVEKYGAHPQAYTFESLIFVIYTNWGIIGFLIWGFFLFLLYKSIHFRIKNNYGQLYLDAFLLLYILFSTVTGEYFFLRWFALFYSILYTRLIKDEKTTNNCFLSASVSPV